MNDKTELQSEVSATQGLSSTVGASLSDSLCVADYIERVEDKSCPYMKRAKVYFKNGRSLSVIQGKGSYGGDAGLFEIAPYSSDGEMDGDLFDDDDKGYSVLGWCDVAKVNHYIAKLGTT